MVYLRLATSRKALNVIGTSVMESLEENTESRLFCCIGTWNERRK